MERERDRETRGGRGGREGGREEGRGGRALVIAGVNRNIMRHCY